MKKNLFIILISLFLVQGGDITWSQDTGTMPVPIFTDATISCFVVFDPITKLYTYTYTVTNSPYNTGIIQFISIDINLGKYGIVPDAEGLTIQRRYNTISYLKEAAISSITPAPPMVPVGMISPEGWCGGITAGGHAMFFPYQTTPDLAPGQTQNGYQLISRGAPGFREVVVEPFWLMVVEESISEEQSDTSVTITESLKVKIKTIGPTAQTSRAYRGRSTFVIQSQIDESIARGWITENALADALKAKLDQAQTHLNHDPTQAKLVLQEALILIDEAPDSHLNSDARGLIYYNINFLVNWLPETFIPPIKMIELKPEKTTHPIGTPHTLTATFFKEQIGNGNDEDTNSMGPGIYPISNHLLKLKIISGPHKDIVINDEYTDSNGQAIFTYTGTKEGTDKIIVLASEYMGDKDKPGRILIAMNEYSGIQGPLLPSNQIKKMILEARQKTISLPMLLAAVEDDGEEPGPISAATMESLPVEVTWTGGPDLFIPVFIPPMIETESGNPIFITESTENQGSTTAEASVTRYFISTDSFINPLEDQVIGEREIPMLAPGESSEVFESQLIVPQGLDPGIYYCGACADADNVVTELNEENNCDINKFALVVSMEKIPQCINDLAARVKSGKVQLTWAHQDDASCYNIYRSTDPKTVMEDDNLIAACHVSTYATYLDLDVVNDTTYYYIVSKVIDSQKECLSNLISAKPIPRRRR